MPPRSRNQRLPAACDAPTAIAASSLVSPLAISRQNNRSTSRRSDGFPGDFIGALPVNAFIHPAGLPINTSKIEMLRRPVESTEYTSRKFGRACRRLGVFRSMGRVGSCFDNAVSETFNSVLKVEYVHRRTFATRAEARIRIATWITDFYNARRLHSVCDFKSPIDYEREYWAGLTMGLAA
ncbi:integrase core domain-containing protein [Streptomyces sp. NBC_01483]|uniref:integrase core domain-containing protein n=1 Tax=Streptomyces sp. NBC_01483 TaxID=2903883 RepID=UPI002E3682E2|nr:integrase core domain-containing protein [Streptomyces sp. NBC_01483]